jgi:hypothetical protein
MDFNTLFVCQTLQDCNMSITAAVFSVKDSFDEGSSRYSHRYVQAICLYHLQEIAIAIPEPVLPGACVRNLIYIIFVLPRAIPIWLNLKASTHALVVASHLF